SVVVAADHVLRGAFWPQSVYGVLVASPWRALEHAGWVAFEDCFLIVSIRRSLQATRAMAEGRAHTEAGRGVIEQQVRVRTRELQASEERFRRLSASAPIGIFETDPEGLSVYTNEHWQRLSGLSGEAMKARGWIDIVHPDDREALIHEWGAALRDARDFYHEYR